MRVITVLTTCIVVVTSFAIRRHSNSVDDDPLGTVVDELEQQLKQLEHRLDANRTGDIALRINSNGMKHLFQHLISSIRHDATRHAPTTIATVYLGMELIIESIQITTFNAPTIHLENKGSLLKVILKGGKANLLGQYTAKYRTNREGQMDVNLEDIEAEIEIDMNGKKITIDDVKCSHSIGVAEVKLTPMLPSQIGQRLKDEIVEKVASKVCPCLQAYLLKAIRSAKKAVRIEEPLQVDGDVVDLIPHNILKASVNDKGAEIIFERRAGAPHNIIPPRESFAMGSVTLSEGYMNDFLFDLADKGDIIFHLDRIPEIHDQLRLKCSGEELCLGTVAKLPAAVDGTAHLEAKAIVAPRLEIHDGVALLKWKLLTTMTYFNSMIGRRIKYLQFNLDILLNVEELKFEVAEEEGRYNWLASYKIKELEVSKVTTYFEEVHHVGGIVPRLVETHREEIELMINDHLTANIPVRINSHIYLSHEATQYQEGQMTFEFNFKTERKLFPSFDFS